MNITEYDEIRAKIDTIKDACNFIPDVTTKEGYEKSKRVSLDVGKVLTSLEKKRKEKKAYFIEGGKEVDSQAKLIASMLAELQLPHKEAYQELDKAKKEREKARVNALESRVEIMRSLAESMADSHSSEVLSAMEQMNSEECLDFFEFTQEALKARNKARSELSDLYTVKLKAEKDAAELEELRKLQAEREQKEREDAIRAEAAEKANKAKIEAEERAAKAEIDAKNAAENARIAEIERVKREEEALEADRVKRESDKKHIGNVRREAKESLMDVGLSEEQAKSVVLAIHAGKILNVSISY